MSTPHPSKNKGLQSLHRLVGWSCYKVCEADYIMFLCHWHKRFRKLTSSLCFTVTILDKWTFIFVTTIGKQLCLICDLLMKCICQSPCLVLVAFTSVSDRLLRVICCVLILWYICRPGSTRVKVGPLQPVCFRLSPYVAPGQGKCCKRYLKEMNISRSYQQMFHITPILNLLYTLLGAL